MIFVQTLYPKSHPYLIVIQTAITFQNIFVTQFTTKNKSDAKL